MKNVLSLFIFIISFNLCAQSFFESPEWLSLLRYEKTFLGYKSLITKDEYFLAKEGRFNPDQELKKTIRLLSEDNNNDIHCKYPARYLLLKKYHLITKNISLSKCERFQKLKSKLNLKSIHLIFSSYFINSPASAFGHTFLKLRSHDSAKANNDLLDYGLDFSAQVTTKNPLLYGVLGITGGFKGEFKLMPYYYKIREYKNVESRDLWDFELDFSRDELIYFVAQLIELRHADFDYFYLSQNCSYHILALLSSVKPSLRLMNKLNLIVPPVDTIYALKTDQKIIKRTSYGPSAYKKMTTRISSLNSFETELFKKILKRPDNYQDILKDITDIDLKLNLLETYSLYIDYSQAKTQYGERDKKYAAHMKYVLKLNLFRSTLKGKTKELDYSNELLNSPLLGHKTRRFKFAYIKNLNAADLPKDQYLLEYRVALHDLMQIQKGFIPNSTTQMGRLEFLIEKNKIRLNNLEIVGVEALRAPTLVEHRYSWRFHMGIKDEKINPKKNFIPYINLSFGKSYNVKKSLLSFFMRSQNSISNIYSNNFAFDLGPELHFILNHNQFALLSSYSYLKSFNQVYNSQKNLLIKLNFNLNKDFSIYGQYKMTTTYLTQRKLQFGLNLSI